VRHCTFAAQQELKTELKPKKTMKSTLNIAVNTDLMALVQTSLQPDELASLFSALTALMTGEDATQHLNTSGLRLAFALLSSPIGTSLKRRATNRANGAKGGRPRKQRTQEAEVQAPTADTLGSPSVTAKKSKKEDLPPTPPIEEKNKKNNSIKNYQKHENTSNKNRWQFIADPVSRREHERQSRLHEVCGIITQLATQGEQPAQVPF
jgi:hypothetical protein